MVGSQSCLGRRSKHFTFSSRFPSTFPLALSSLIPEAFSEDPLSFLLFKWKRNQCPLQMFKGRGCNRLKEFSEIPNSENDLPRLPYTPVIRDKSIRFVITSPPPPLGTIPSLTCKTPLNLPDESVPAHSYSSWTSLMKQQPIPTQTQQQCDNVIMSSVCQYHKKILF